MMIPTSFGKALAALSLLIAMCSSCHKDRQDHSSMLAGTYRWHHYTWSNTPFVGDTTIYGPDETFPVEANNRTHILVKGEELAYKSTDGSMVTFVNGSSTGTARTLIYNTITRSITYTISTHTSAAGNSRSVYETF